MVGYFLPDDFLAAFFEAFGAFLVDFFEDFFLSESPKILSQFSQNSGVAPVRTIGPLIVMVSLGAIGTSGQSGPIVFDDSRNCQVAGLARGRDACGCLYSQQSLDWVAPGAGDEKRRV